MKIFFLNVFIFTNLFFAKDLLSFDNIYETNFFNVEKNNEIINESKISEIDKIKKLSFHKLLKKVLLRDDYNALIKTIKLDNKIDYLIQSILINDEFISSKKYKAKIKINFDKNEIIKFLRKNQINYTDLTSPNFLVLVAESRNILQMGISKDNSFYDVKLPDSFNLVNLIYPELSVNDRFITSYENIIEKDIKSLSKISLKYNINNILIISLESKKNIYKINISTFSLLDNKIVDISNLNLQSLSNYRELVFAVLDNWWKENNLIDNSEIRTEFCKIKSSNIKELYYINSIINSISQVKSNNLSEIKLNENINEIIFYGSLDNLFYKLLHNKINLYFNSENICFISIDY